MASCEKVWQLQDAKARFSEFVRHAVVTPQIVSVRGESKVVMVSLSYFKQTNSIKPSFKDLIASIPVKI
jgi:prevent-host-death family protein